MKLTSADQSASFAATIDHAIRLHAKSELLKAQAREALLVASDLAGRALVSREALLAAHEALQAAQVPGRGLIVVNRYAEAGERFTRLRGATDPWPKAPAWVYLLKDQAGVILSARPNTSPTG